MKKKMLFVFFLSVFALVLTGCGGSGNKLVCTIKDSVPAGQYEINYSSEIVMGLKKGDIVDSLKMSIEIVIPEDAYNDMKQEGDINENMEYVAQMFMQGFTSQLPQEYAKTDYKIKKNKIEVTSTVDMTKANEEKTKQEAIESFEGNGYTCK